MRSAPRMRAGVTAGWMNRGRRRCGHSQRAYTVGQKGEVVLAGDEDDMAVVGV